MFMVVFTLHQLKHEKWRNLYKDEVVQLTFFKGKLAMFCVATIYLLLNQLNAKTKTKKHCTHETCIAIVCQKMFTGFSTYCQL